MPLNYLLCWIQIKILEIKILYIQKNNQEKQKRIKMLKVVFIIIINEKTEYFLQ